MYMQVIHVEMSFLLACGAEVGVNEKDLLSCDNRSPVVGVDGFEPPTLCL